MAKCLSMASYIARWFLHGIQFTSSLIRFTSRTRDPSFRADKKNIRSRNPVDRSASEEVVRCSLDSDGEPTKRANVIRSLFKDEGPLAIEYVPLRLLHRDEQLGFLRQLFRFTTDDSGSIVQRVLVTGNAGTGKTVLSQRFGMYIVEAANARKVNLHYVHVNCRECGGNLSRVMNRVMTHFNPHFPRRGFSAEELLEVLVTLLGEMDAYAILALDEFDSLIRIGGSRPVCNIVSLQEDRPGPPHRLSLICMLEDRTLLGQLDKSTVGALTLNLIHLPDYSCAQLETILQERIGLAFKEGAVPSETVKLIADLASVKGDAGYAIELLRRAGKCAESEGAGEVKTKHVMEAAGRIHPAFREDWVKAFSTQQKLLLLGVARALAQTGSAYATMGEVEKAYEASCKEYREKPRGHTQIWKYLRRLKTDGAVSTKKSGAGRRGKTTLVGIPSTSASVLRRMLEETLEASSSAKLAMSDESIR